MTTNDMSGCADKLKKALSAIEGIKYTVEALAAMRLEDVNALNNLAEDVERAFGMVADVHEILEGA